MLMCRWLVVLTLSLIPTAVGAVGQNFYIAPWGNNANDCRNRDNPCQTMSRAWQVMGGGDTLVLRGGDYNDDGLRTGAIPNGPSASQRTTVMGMQGETPIMHRGVFFYAYNTAPNTHQNIQIGPNIIFDPEAISFYGGQIHNIRLIGLEIRNTGSHDCISFGDFAGVPNAIGYPTGIEVIDNHLHDCGVAGGPHCMYACSPGTIVRGNHMHSCGSYSLQWYDSGREGCGANAEIYGNYFHESQQVQFRSGDCHDCSGEVTLNFGDNIKFYNNVIKGVGQFGGGVELGRNSTNGHIYNNTIITPSGNSAIGTGNVNGVTIRNNITYGSAVPIAMRSDSYNVVADYNSGQDTRFPPCGGENNT